MDITLLSQEQLNKYGYRTSRIVDHTLDDARLETRCPLDNGRHHGLEPKHSAGKLGLLPAELIAEILLALDVPSLTVFRCVNRRAMHLVDSLHEYQMVFNHCPNILHAIISVDSKHFDCRTLFRVLSTTKCATCDRFGGYLYLITCKRVCYLCFTKDSLFLPVTATHAKKLTGLESRELRCLPHITSLPGRYTEFNKMVQGRIMLLDWQSVRGNMSDIHPQENDDRPELCRTIGHPRRCMSIISAPYFISSDNSSYWGYYCTECLGDTDPATHFRIKYTEDGFQDHIIRRLITSMPKLKQ